jgi:Flp pilus assembly protein TadG
MSADSAMKDKQHMKKTASLARRFAKDGKGVAATEFALLLPVMLAMYIGAVEVTEAYYVDRRLTMTTRVAGDLVARDLMIGQPITYIRDKIGLSLSTMEPAKVNGTAFRITTYAVDKGNPAYNSGEQRAFVDWQVTCYVTAYTTAAGPTVSCSIGTEPNSAGTGPSFTGGLKRCDIDPSVPVNVQRPGTPLVRVETKYTHMPILAGLFTSGGGGPSWLSFIDGDGFDLERYYYTYPRPNTRNEGPTAPNLMQVKVAGVSSDQSLEPASLDVCQSPNINPEAERFVP